MSENLSARLTSGAVAASILDGVRLKLEKDILAAMSAHIQPIIETMAKDAAADVCNHWEVSLDESYDALHNRNNVIVQFRTGNVSGAAL
jgi:hypothetical protein